MPAQVEAKDLGSWEQRFNHVRSRVSKTEQETLGGAASLLIEVFEFGAHNLYGAFDEVGSTTQYQDLVKSLNQALGSTIEPTHDVTRW